MDVGAALAVGPTASNGAGFAIEDVILIDGNGGVPVADAVVLVRGDRIVHAGPKRLYSDRMPATRFSLPGKVVIPGLIEAHTHASYDSDMLAYVRNGITTLRFAGLDQRNVAKLKGRIEAGELVGPRILSCGPMIDAPPPAYPDWSVSVRTPAEAAATATRLITEDKVDSLILTQRITAPLMRAVCDTAHSLGRRVLAQTWELDGAEAAGLGIDEVHNSSRVFSSKEYPRERLLAYTSIAERLALSGRGWATLEWDATQKIIDAMVAAKVVYCGMQVITQYQLDEGLDELQADPQFIALFGETERSNFVAFIRKLQGSWSAEDFAHWRVANENRLEWMRRFRAAGGVLVFGTDMQFGGIMMHREFQNALRLGMTPLEVIAAATGGTARALGLDGEFGTITAGNKADLIVLNRSPATDLFALRDIHSVMREGQVLWSAGIPAHRSA